MIRFDDICGEKGIFWFVGINDHILYKMDEHFYVTKECNLPSNNMLRDFRLFSRLLKNDNSIFCFPINENRICVFDIENHSINEINLPVEIGKKVGLDNNWIKDGYLWSLSASRGKILEIDISNNSYVREHIIPFEGVVYQATLRGNKIIIPCRKDCSLVEFDTDTQTSEIRKLICDDMGFATAFNYGNDIILTGMNEAVYFYGVINNEVYKFDFSELKMFEYVENEKSPLFFKTIATERYIAFAPCNTKDHICSSILTFDTHTKSFKSINVGQNSKKKRGMGHHIYIWHYIKDEIFALDSMDNSLYRIDLYTSTVTFLPVKVDPSLKQYEWISFSNVGGIVLESATVGMKDLLEFVSNE